MSVQGAFGVLLVVAVAGLVVGLPTAASGDHASAGPEAVGPAVASLHPSSASRDTWLDITPRASGTSGPPASRLASMAFDATDNATVLFGGCSDPTCTTPTNNTWVFSAGIWHNVTNYSQAPPARFGAAFWFDPTNGSAWLFGGCGSTCPLNDTWYFHADRWVNWTARAGTAPPGVWGAGSVYYAHDQSGMVVGGCTAVHGPRHDCSATTNATWMFTDLLFSCLCWLPASSIVFGITGSAPSVMGEGLTYDPSAAGIVLYGGQECGTKCGDQNWTYELGDTSASWVNETSASQSLSGSGYPSAARTFPVLEYDAHDGYVLLAGGAEPAIGGPTNASYYEKNLDWTPVNGTGPAVGSAASSSNSSADQPLVFGGLSSSGLTNRTWVWDQPIAPLSGLLDGCSACSFAFEPNESIQFNTSALGGGTGPLSVFWQFGAGITSSSRNGTYAYPYLPRQNLSIGLTGFDGSGAYSTVRLNGSCLCDPSLVLTTPPPTDVGLLTNWSATCLTDGSLASVSWQFGDGSTASTTTCYASHAYASAGAFQMNVSFADSLGNSASASQRITVVAYPVVSASASPSPTEPALSTAFSASITGGVAPFAYNWSFGDGATSNLTRPSHSYAANGNYTVRLDVTDARGAHANTTFTEAVLGLSVHATVDVNQTDVGLPVHFVGNATGGSPTYTYRWHFGDGATSSLAITNHSYSTAGTYTATLDVTDGNGVVVNTTVTVAISPRPGVHGSANPSPTEPGFPTTFLATVTGGTPPFVYNWSFGDGQTSNRSNATHVYASDGSYTVRITVTDLRGLSASQSFSEVVQGPSASASSNVTQTDVGVPIAFRGIASGGTPGYSYLWSFGDGSTNASAMTAHAYSLPGNFTATLTVTDAHGASAVSSPINLTITARPSVVILVTSGPADQNSMVNFSGVTTNGTVPYTYAWTFGDGGTGTGMSVNHTYPTVGTFAVTLTATDLRGQAAHFALNETVHALPTVVASSTPTVTDVLVEVNFTSVVTGGSFPFNYSWSFGDHDGSTRGDPTYAYPAAGVWNVTLTVTDRAGRVAYSTPLMIRVNLAPEVAFTSQPAALVAGIPEWFNASVTAGSGNFSYLWTFGDGQNATGQDVVHTFATAGSYAVRVRVIDGVGGQANLTRTLTVAASPAASRGPTSHLTLSTTALLLLLIVAAAVVLVVLVLLLIARRGRRPRQPTPLTPFPPPSTPPTGGWMPPAGGAPP